MEVASLGSLAKMRASDWGTGTFSTGKEGNLTFDSSLLNRQSYIGTLRGSPKNDRP